MSNDMIEIKKQVVESPVPMKAYCPYNRSPTSPSQPVNVISSAESDQDVEDASTTEEEMELEEEVE